MLDQTYSDSNTDISFMENTGVKPNYLEAKFQVPTETTINSFAFIKTCQLIII